MRIDRIELSQVELPFRQAYGGSRTPLTSLRTVVVEVRDRLGRAGWGEAAIYTGYTHETLPDAWAFWREISEGCAGGSIEEAKARVRMHGGERPFATTALMTAFEMLEQHPVLNGPAVTARIPLLAPVYARTLDEVQDEVDGLLAAGFRTLKVKIGLDVDADLLRVGRIQHAASGRARLRLDANQQYGAEDACRFARSLDPDGIELLEQPCRADDWAAARAVAQVARVPMMLDESIYRIEDIDRAYELRAASFLKLKLMKSGGLDNLLRGLGKIAGYGMKSVLGNGVASEISCWMEACVARTAISNDGEMNGFLKPTVRLFREPLPYERGAIVLRPGFWPDLDRAALDAHTGVREVFGKATA